ncbi:MAG: hypothetical protein M5U14_04500 [Acidimicrobiia bacterium]|nr:hypothetical protein [Acidimicrobiia bacterium]
MDLESRDSVSLKPVELDELGQILESVGLPMTDEELDQQVEQFPLAALATEDGAIQAFLLGSLERIGGTPCILWGLGAASRGRHAGASVKALAGELYRRAAISFPDEDVLVAGRLAHPAAYALLGALTDVVPRPGYSPTGEERAWGRRLVRRFCCRGEYDERTFRLAPNGASEPVFHAGTAKGGGKKAAELLGELDPARGEAVIAFGWATAEALADGSLANGS